MITGIDVSKWNGTIRWAEVAKSQLVSFAFIRASYGASGPNVVDGKFKQNWHGASDAGVVRGAYHFMRATQPGSIQAKIFLDLIAGAGGMLEGDISPMLDIENSEGGTPSTILKCVEDWLLVIETETKRRPIIYTNPEFWKQYKLGGMFRAYPLCISDYRSNPSPEIPAGTWSDWAMWQFTESGSVSGIDGSVDQIRFRGELEDLASMRTSSETTGISYATFPKAIRYVQRWLKTMPKIQTKRGRIQ